MQEPAATKKRPFIVRLSPALHTELRAYSERTGVPMSRFAADAIRERLRKQASLGEEKGDPGPRRTVRPARGPGNAHPTTPVKASAEPQKKRARRRNAAEA